MTIEDQIAAIEARGWTLHCLAHDNNDHTVDCSFGWMARIRVKNGFYGCSRGAKTPQAALESAIWSAERQEAWVPSPPIPPKHRPTLEDAFAGL